MTEASTDEEAARTRPFADVLLELNRGRTHAEASRAMQDLVQAVIDTGKKGSVTVVISVSKSKASGQIEIADDVRIKLPAADRSASLFFVDDEFNLTRDDPNQPHLPLREVPAATAPTELRKAD